MSWQEMDIPSPDETRQAAVRLFPFQMTDVRLREIHAERCAIDEVAQATPLQLRPQRQFQGRVALTRRPHSSTHLGR